MYKNLRDSIADICNYPKFGDLASVNDTLYAVIDLVLSEHSIPKYMRYTLIGINIEKLYSGQDNVEEIKCSNKIYTEGAFSTRSITVVKKGVATGELLAFLEKKRLERDMVEVIEK